MSAAVVGRVRQTIQVDRSTIEFWALPLDLQQLFDVRVVVNHQLDRVQTFAKCDLTGTLPLGALMLDHILASDSHHAARRTAQIESQGSAPVNC